MEVILISTKKKTRKGVFECFFLKLLNPKWAPNGRFCSAFFWLLNPKGTVTGVFGARSFKYIGTKFSAYIIMTAMVILHHLYFASKSIGENVGFLAYKCRVFLVQLLPPAFSHLPPAFSHLPPAFSHLPPPFFTGGKKNEFFSLVSRVKKTTFLARTVIKYRSSSSSTVAGI